MKNNHQSGNAVIWIFIAVALFAALGYAFTNSTRTSTNVITDAQAKAYAQQIIAHGNEVKQAVKRLQLRGCSDTEISFENNIVTGYTNPNAPTSNKCHVFNRSGGGLNWAVQQEGSWAYNGSHTVNGLNGDTRPTTDAASKDLIAFVSGITSKQICVKINDIYNYNFTTNPPPNNDITDTKFVGVYDTVNGISDSPDETETIGLSAVCSVNKDVTDTYLYYTVLIAR